MFHYVYIIQFETNSERFYIGFTEDLAARLKTHDAGRVPLTANFLPWRIKTAVAFNEREKAFDFERYLKSPSGRAFTKTRLSCSSVRSVARGEDCRPLWFQAVITQDFEV